MSLNAQSRYPSLRTYVLKVRVDAQLDAVAGRLASLVTGRQLEFASGRAPLDAIAAEPAAGRDGHADG